MLLLGASTGPPQKLCQAQGIYVSSLTHFLCCKVQISLEQSERAGPASSPSSTCISYCFFYLPSDLIASFSFGLYLRLHWLYLLLSPPSRV